MHLDRERRGAAMGEKQKTEIEFQDLSKLQDMNIATERNH